MGGLECRPEGNLPVLQKINHLAIRLGGETPDGVFDGGSVTIDLNSDAARRLEQYIGYNSGTSAQATLLAQHWGEVRAFVAALQGGTGTTVTQSSLSVLTASDNIEGDTDDAARLRAGVLLESAAMLLRIFGSGNACAPTVLVDGALPRFAANPTEIRRERNSITTVASLYVRMGGEDDDGGLPDGTLSAPVTLSDVELREIDHLVGYRPPSEPASPDDNEAGSELIRNWQGVRELILALRNPTGVIDSAALDQITDRPARERAAVQLQTVAGILRILHSEAWRAGRAYGTSAAPLVTATASITAGSAFALAAPEGGWRAGDQVFVDNVVLAGVVVPTSGNAALNIPAAALPAGEHALEIRRTGGAVVRTPVNVAAAVSPPPNAGTSTTVAPPSSDWNVPSWVKWVAGALGVFGTGLGLGWLISRNRGTPPTGGNPPPARNNNAANDRPNPAPTDTRTEARADRQSSNPPPPPKTGAGNANPQPAAPVDDMDDVLKDLEAARGQQSPAGINPGAPAAAATVTADNIIIEGPNAAPVNGVDPAVIRAQVALHYRHFLSQTAREALQDGRALPPGTELVASRFEVQVQEITDRLVASYYERNKSGTLQDLWDAQRDPNGGRGYIVRRGVPERLLLEIASDYIAEHSTSASSPFSGGVGAEMRSNAERDAGETRFMRDSLREVMRFAGR